MKTIKHQGKFYPHYQSTGNAARFILPFAKEVCQGTGYDIGCNRLEWAFPGATPIDLTFGSDALALPEGEVDYIFSSHCLEHLPDWVGAMNHWRTRLKDGGQLFLYLPHFDQTYWRPWFNRKHMHCFTPNILWEFLMSGGWYDVFISERDLNHSFAVMATKSK